MGIKVNIGGVAQSLNKFIEVIASGINYAKDVFYSFVALKKFELQFNAQSIYLCEYLNQVFDPVQKRIYIVNDSVLFETYLFRNSESILLDDQVYLFRNSESITSDEQVYLDRDTISPGINFQVVVPSTLSSLQTNSVFLASIRKYAFVDKSFEVIIN